jgi:predicted nucleic acid-binding protein
VVIVSDTTPINYLVLIEHIDILPSLFGQILIPEKVFEELQRDETPETVRAWLESNPVWLAVRAVIIPDDPTLEGINDGEKEAILLAEELNADAILMDDKDGRKAAHNRGLVTIGTLGILDKAAERGLINLEDAINKLRETNFREPKEIVEAMLEEDAKRHR